MSDRSVSRKRRITRALAICLIGGGPVACSTIWGFDDETFAVGGAIPADGATPVEGSADSSEHADGLADAGGRDGGSADVSDSGPAADTNLPPTAFTGAPAFVTRTGGPTDNAGHNGSFANNNPVGQNCFTCHKDGGAGVPFVLGGSVYKNAAGTMAAGAGVEIRVRDNAGVFMTTYTDALGNFYLAQGATGANPVSPNSLVGVRDGLGNVGTMLQKLADATQGGCVSAGCHGNGAAAGPLHLP